MVSLRLGLASLGSIALIPVVLYAIGRSEPVVALSVVSVLLIAASLYLMFSPHAQDESTTSH